MGQIRLSGPQQLRIQAALERAFLRGGLVELLLALDKRYENIERTDWAYPRNVLQVVKEAAAGDWLIELMQEAHRRVPEDPEFPALLAEFAVPSAVPGVDHFEVCRLDGDRVLIDRQQLRHSLRRVHDPRGPRILVVKGGSKSGKSHTARFITYLGWQLGAFSLASIDLSDLSRLSPPGKLIEPTDIAECLLTKLRYKLRVDKRPNDEQWARWVLRFCDKLETKAMEDPRITWIVIDALDSEQLTQPAQDLVKELAIRVDRTLVRFRLVLLGYGDYLPPDLIPRACTEQIEPIGREHVVDFFVTAFEQHRIPCDENTLLAILDRVLDGIDPAAPDFLAVVSGRAADELTKVVGVGGG